MTPASRVGDRGVTHVALCDLAIRKRDFAAARSHCERAVADITTAYGPSSPRLAIAFNTSGALANAQGQWADARAFFLKSTQIYEANHATDALTYALAMSNIGATFSNQDDDAHAVSYFERSRDLFAAHHPDHPQRAIPLQGLANTALRLGDPAKALASNEAARTIIEAAYPPDSFEHLVVLYNLALGYRETHQPAKVTPLVDELVERAGRHDHEQWALLGRAFELRAALLDDRRQPEAAIAAREQAVAAYGHTNDAASLAWTEMSLGNALLELHQAPRALPHFEHALVTFRADDTAAYERGVTEFGLARAHWDLGQRDAAIAAARLSRSELAAARTGTNLARIRAEVERWCRGHGAS